MVFLDPTFGNEGLVITDFGAGTSKGDVVLLQPNGRILLIGSIVNGNNSGIALAGYLSNGALDTSFSVNGKATTLFPNVAEVKGISSTLQADGKILVIATIKTGDTYDLTVLRYNTDGSLDTGFAQGGQLRLDLHESDPISNSIVVQSDGTIVVIRSTQNSQGLSASFNLVLMGYQSNGLPDPSFGVGGQAILSLGRDGLFGVGVADAVLQPDGKILVLSNRYSMFSGGQLSRFTIDGSLDTSFSGGQTTFGFGKYDQFHRIIVQPDGKILVGGGGTFDGVLTRYNSDGTMDSGFGNHGVSHISTIGSSSNTVMNLAIQPDGKILVATADALLRLDQQGNLDPTFPYISKLPIAISTDFVLTPDGRVIIAGATGNGSETEFALTRYVLDNVIVPTDNVIIPTDNVIVPRSFTGNARNNRMTGNSFDNLLAGLGGNDRLFGLAGNDTLLGGMGDDRLVGGTGDDELQGGSGNDVLQVGLGSDRVIGGKGRDTILFNTNARFNSAYIGVATLVDFNPKQDRIRLKRETFNTKRLRFAVVNSVQAAASAPAEITYIQKSGNLFFNANVSRPGFGLGGQFADLPAGLVLKPSVFSSY